MPRAMTSRSILANQYRDRVMWFQAEIEVSLFSRQCLGRRRIPSLGHLRREARAWGRRMNRDRVSIAWRFTRKQARLKFGYRKNNIARSRY